MRIKKGTWTEGQIMDRIVKKIFFFCIYTIPLLEFRSPRRPFPFLKNALLDSQTLEAEHGKAKNMSWPTFKIKGHDMAMSRSHLLLVIFLVNT